MSREQVPHAAARRARGVCRRSSGADRRKPGGRREGRRAVRRGYPRGPERTRDQAADARADELFDVIDADGNGTIEREELRRYLLGGGGRASEGGEDGNASFAELVAQLDLNGDVLSRGQLPWRASLHGDGCEQATASSRATSCAEATSTWSSAGGAPRAAPLLPLSRGVPPSRCSASSVPQRCRMRRRAARSGSRTEPAAASSRRPPTRWSCAGTARWGSARATCSPTQRRGTRSRRRCLRRRRRGGAAWLAGGRSSSRSTATRLESPWGWPSRCALCTATAPRPSCSALRASSGRARSSSRTPTTSAASSVSRAALPAPPFEPRRAFSV